jgi:hypothetical protein
MPIPFYMDEHIPKAITLGLRLRDVDVLTRKTGKKENRIRRFSTVHARCGGCCSPLTTISCQRPRIAKRQENRSAALSMRIR